MLDLSCQNIVIKREFEDNQSNLGAAEDNDEDSADNLDDIDEKALPDLSHMNVDE